MLVNRGKPSRRFPSCTACLVVCCISQIIQSAGLAEVDLLFVVPSCWRSLQRRNHLRRLFSRHAAELTATAFAHRFIMSETPQKDASTDSAADELRKYSDLVLLGPYDCNPPLESHRAFVLNDREAATTYKVRHCFRWAVQAFSFLYFLKLDDDSYVQVSGMHQQLLSGMPASGLAYFGYMVAPDPTTDEAIVDYYQTSFPYTFALGMCWGITASLAKLLAATNLPLKTYGSEDMSVGLWLMPIEGIQYVHVPFMHDHPSSKSPFNRSCSNDSLVVHRMDGYWDQVAWDEFATPLKCSHLVDHAHGPGLTKRILEDL